MPDIIGEFVERLLARDPTVSVETADRLTHDLRNAWGGKRVYIRQCPELKATAPRVTRPRKR